MTSLTKSNLLLPRSAPFPSMRFFATECTIVLGLILFVIFVMGPITVRWVLDIFIAGDQVFHLQVAIDMNRTNTLITPHFLYQALVIALHSVVPDAGWTFSAVAVNLLCQLFSALFIYVALKMTLTRARSRFSSGAISIISLVTAVGLLIMAPLIAIPQAFGVQINPMLLGFVTPITYHNPTITTLRPVAILLFFTMTTLLAPQPSLKKPLPIAGVIAFTTVLVVLNGLSKPNFLIVLIPALSLWMVGQFIFRRRNAWAVSVIGIVVPGLLMLGWQYYFTYLNPNMTMKPSGIIFAPLEVITSMIKSQPTTLLLFSVSFLFPLSVIAFLWREAKRDVSFQFAGLMFVIALAYMYLFAESGERMYHGNFFWSAYICAWILQFASAHLALRAWLTESSGVSRWRILIIGFFFFAQVASGLHFIHYSNQIVVSV